ncbi:NAD(P)/FAD-dependent oxidoreductase [Thalassotalea marina]|uniref:FAD-dependent oxidoreductase n=1 Tax=Thalassotalea marina TaxID=1673741 RepID=A0A919BLD2_9GAMM|nr:NAD(P)/FAD-dependent oxidoreductase [Thalassotalea marina]GHF97112.1 FAD-dependent oxidoreductase [Thalassotalea marina]
MKTETVDVIIIGAGPSGAVAGAMLAREGIKVLIVEKEHFPRFSIGESLLPQCMEFLAQAGLVDQVTEQAPSLAFQFKNGAAFCNQVHDIEFDFTQKFSTGPGTTFQVKRADFDKVLADGAEAQGVEIRYGHQVLAVNVADDQPTIDVQDEQGNEYQVQGQFLLDASGFGRVLPRLLDLETPSDFPVRHSFFAHFNDQITDPSFDRDKILITVHPQYKDVWYWLIPFSDGTASVGVVGEPARFDPSLTEQQTLLSFIEQADNLKALLAQATLANNVRTIKGYSANVSRLHGNNFALLGNAGEFLDPVFSSGVTIALKSASLIAPLIVRKLNGESIDLENDYAKPLKAGVDCFRTFVTAWYDGRFQDVIFYGQQDQQVKSMISSILAGYAWDIENPYVAQSERRLNVLAQLCKNG